MRRKRLGSMSCSIAKALDVVGDPWTLLILRDSFMGVVRFDQFAARLGIPRATLASRLELLCDQDVLARAVDRASQRRVEYRLTPKGEALLPVLITLMRWGDDWVRDDEPPTRVVEAASGRTVDPVLVDRSTGRPLDELGVHVVSPITVGRPARREDGGDA